MPKRVSLEHRSLGTARAVLRVLALMGEHPEGVSVEEVAQHLGKSTYTAYYLLNSLCQEGFAEHVTSLHRYVLIAQPKRKLRSPGKPDPPELLIALKETLEDLYRATNCRSYLWIYDGDHTVLREIKGRQGQPRVRDIGNQILHEAHATAIGKAVLAHLPTEEYDRYIRFRGLRLYTTNTITDPKKLDDELEQIRFEGLAYCREEYLEYFCGVAFPLVIQYKGQTLIAALGAAVPLPRYVKMGAELARQVRGVAEYARANIERMSFSASAFFFAYAHPIMGEVIH